MRKKLYYPGDRYSLTMISMHWLMAVVFLFMWASGYIMSDVAVEDSPLQEWLFGLHISCGITLLFLLLLRVALRITSDTPELHKSFSRFENTAARLGHLGLYLLPLLIILAGWAGADFGGHQLEWFGIAMPKLFPTMDSFLGINLEDFTEESHEILAYGMLALALVHIAAVVKHRLDGQDVLYRMAFWKKR